MGYTSLWNGIKDIMVGLRDSFGKVFPNLYFFAHRKYLDFRFAFTKNHKKQTIKKYKKMFKQTLDLDNPKTFYEKINYLRLNYCNNALGKMIDKYLVKDFLKGNGYSEYTPNIIGHYYSFKDFQNDFRNVISKNNQFVVKLTHTSGDVFFYNNGVWRDKKGKNVSKRFVFACLKQNIKHNYYHHNFEKEYDLLKGSVLVEEYIPSFQELGMDELKIFANYGEPILINYVVGRQNKGHVREAFLNKNLVKYDAKQDQEILDLDRISIPPYYDKMLEFCTKTCNELPLVRIDFLCNKDTFYFCEFTLYDCSGMNIFYPLERNIEFGSLIRLERRI